MRTVRPLGVASCMVAAVLGLTGCETVASAEDEAINAASTVEPAPDGPARLLLTDDSVRRLGIDTSPVEGEPGDLTIPYGALVYAPDGTSWAFVQLQPGVYQRAPVTVATVVDDVVRLTNGPAPGTQVVSVASAELIGVEAGISGGE
jgi:hypothetical protein